MGFCFFSDPSRSGSGGKCDREPLSGGDSRKLPIGGLRTAGSAGPKCVIRSVAGYDRWFWLLLGLAFGGTVNAQQMEPLTPRERRVIEEKGTEAPYTGRYYLHREAGTYVCRRCGAPLYRSEDKFDAGCGWPSFDDEIPGAVRRIPDADGLRTEIVCARCDAHLGHVFTDEGFTPKNTRHCVNSLSLGFVPAAGAEPEVAAGECGAAAGTGIASERNAAAGGPAILSDRSDSSVPSDGSAVSGEPDRTGDVSDRSADSVRAGEPDAAVKTETAIFAGGCFWGVEYMLASQPGVLDAEAGYTGGRTEHPTYEEVCGHRTGHAEAVRVTFDPAQVSYEELARLFFEIHDPTQAGRQGPDVGPQYRSEIFYTSPEQRKTAVRLIAELRARGYRVVTRVTPAGSFWPAEAYHQDYYERRGTQPYCHVYTKRF